MKADVQAGSSEIPDCAANRMIGWTSLALGALTGLVMGMWSFDGPVNTPHLLGDYADTARRLARLGHIAFFGLGFINLFLARELVLLRQEARTARLTCLAMNLGNIFLPLTLFLAAVYHPAKYLLVIPAACVTLAVTRMAYGECTAHRRAVVDDRLDVTKRSRKVSL